jgi:hypothetical protein
MAFKSEKIKLELTAHQLQLIIESVLFTISPEINHTLYRKEITELIDLLIEIRSNFQHIPTTNISINKSVDINSEFSSLISSYFPELLLN